MKDINKLKQEQVDLKERLARLVDFMTTEDYYTLSDKEKALLNQQRSGMEIYLNALTERIYNPQYSNAMANMMMYPLLLSFMNSSNFGFGSNDEFKRLEEQMKNIEIKQE